VKAPLAVFMTAFMTRCGRTWLLFFGCFWLIAAHAGELQPERDFRLIEPPLAATEAGKIEVIEFFWYGCPHCAALEPLLDTWNRSLPQGVNLRRVPAISHAKWISGARLYYTLEALHQVGALHGEVFAAIHGERLRLLDDEAALTAWIERHGIARSAFLAAWNSFGVQAQVREAQRLTQAAAIRGVPALIVAGRYQALTEGSYRDLLRRTDQLIAQSRSPGVSPAPTF